MVDEIAPVILGAVDERRFPVLARSKHPASTTHGQLEEAELEAAGVRAGTMRLSVDIEDAGDLSGTSNVPGMDQADFAPRLTKPTLMVNGRYDWTFPLESSQKPLFQMLGTAPADKRHVVFDTPHDVRLRRTDLVKEVLEWYDRYLGTVN